MTKKILAAILVSFLSLSLVSFLPTKAANTKKIKLNKKSIILNVGRKSTIKVTSKSRVKWKTSNKKIASVSAKGIVTAKKAGNTQIIAYKGNQKAICNVKVNPVSNNVNSPKLTLEYDFPPLSSAFVISISPECKGAVKFKYETSFGIFLPVVSGEQNTSIELPVGTSAYWRSWTAGMVAENQFFITVTAYDADGKVLAIEQMTVINNKPVNTNNVKPKITEQPTSNSIIETPTPRKNPTNETPPVNTPVLTLEYDFPPFSSAFVISISPECKGAVKFKYETSFGIFLPIVSGEQNASIALPVGTSAYWRSWTAGMIAENQFFITVTAYDADGKVLASEQMAIINNKPVNTDNVKPNTL